MSWRERIRPARFNGAPFFVDSSARTGGRKTVLHEYPLRDVPFSEDLGRKARKFNLEGYVIGPNYLDARDNLIAALETSGPGQLDHPTYGVRRCAVDGFTVRETKTDGGMAIFSIEFVETPESAIEPDTSVDAAGALAGSADALTESSKAVFLATFSPGVYLGSASLAVINATRAIRNSVDKVDMDTQALASLVRNLDNLSAAVGTLVGEPLALVDSLQGVFAGITLPEIGIAVYGFDPGLRPPNTTPNRLQEQTNFDAVQRLIQRMALVRSAVLTAEQAFSSYEDAVTARDTLADMLDDQAESSSDDAYPALVQLRADLVKALPGDDRDLPHLSSVTPPATVPSLVLAYRLYGDVGSEQDIVDRNKAKHPGFLVGGTALEVLSRG